MTEVLKDSFETRMKIREFEAKIKNLAKRVNEIEYEQQKSLLINESGPGKDDTIH